MRIAAVGDLRARTVQVHGKAAPRASAGQRTAVNLPGVEATAISRGQSLAHPGVVDSISVSADQEDHVGHD